MRGGSRAALGQKKVDSIAPEEIKQSGSVDQHATSEHTAASSLLEAVEQDGSPVQHAARTPLMRRIYRREMLSSFGSIVREEGKQNGALTQRAAPEHTAVSGAIEAVKQYGSSAQHAAPVFTQRSLEHPP